MRSIEQRYYQSNMNCIFKYYSRLKGIKKKWHNRNTIQVEEDAIFYCRWAHFLSRLHTSIPPIGLGSPAGDEVPLRAEKGSWLRHDCSLRFFFPMSKNNAVSINNLISSGIISRPGIKYYEGIPQTWLILKKRDKKGRLCLHNRTTR